MIEEIEVEKQLDLITNFITTAKEDPRVSMAHISLYTALVSYWFANGKTSPLCVFSHDIMPICKISGAATYHRSIRQLDEYGYIKYVPSFNHFLGSLVFLINK
ncbi:MAG: hypothetical protein ABIN01_01200 [Ferruginibacter sp.]